MADMTPAGPSCPPLSGHIPIFVIEDDEPVRLPDGPLMLCAGVQESDSLISAPADRAAAKKRGFLSALWARCGRCWRRGDGDEG